MKLLEGPKTLRKLGVGGEATHHQAGAPILEVKGVSLRYETGLALDDVTFRLQAGERVAVVGPNGAGKSTLFKVIAGVSAPTSGEVRVAGYKPGGHICIAYLPQRSQVNWNFPVSVADVVMMGRVGRLGALHWPSGQDWSFVRTCLEAVGLERLSDRQISELSGGQQQRMFIARGLAQEAELLLMDEPLNGLDVTSQQIIFQVLDELRSKGVTVMIATHDLDQAGEYFDRVMLLNRRLIGFGLPGEVFSASRLMEAYGSHLRIVKAEEGFVALGDSCCEDGEGG